MTPPDAGLRAAGAELRRMIKRGGHDVLAFLVECKVITRADLIAWELDDMRAFHAQLAEPGSIPWADVKTQLGLK